MKLIIYDGSCGFCDQTVQFILKNKPTSDVRFIAANSEIGVKLLMKYNESLNPETILFFHNGKLFSKSSAMLEIIRNTTTLLKFLYILKFIPSKYRDIIYDNISSKRYLIFGNIDSCKIPDRNDKIYFNLDNILNDNETCFSNL